ncbi:MAG: heparan-alpha-glucosaminide N-acetyltransferase [Methanoregula sp.]|jgi:uncharacterized membrane protein
MDVASRYHEIDMARGIAILMMVLFHTLFDLNYFQIFIIQVYDGFWRYFSFATASLFLLIVGISLTISRSRAVSKISGHQLTLKFVSRGAGIFLLGLLVTVGTWIYIREGFIVFGILHLIGVAIMISPLFFRFKKFNLVLGLLFVAIGFFIASVTGPVWLLPLGIHPAAFLSVDYEPLFPWYGIVLVGMGLGEYLYPEGKRGFALLRIPVFFERPLAFLGQHSLVIYLVHQPLIILLLAAVFGIKLF